MNTPTTSEETETQWKLLLEVRALTTPKSTRMTKSSPEDDPFDCSSLAVPPTHALVEEKLQEYLVRWNQLDDRKVRGGSRTAPSHLALPSSLKKRKADEMTLEDFELEQEGEPDNAPAGAPPSASVSNSVPGGWRYKDDRLQLPPGFDYATTRSGPPDDTNCDRVLSLDAPMTAAGYATESYHKELWKLFASLPHWKDLDHEARDGHQLHNTIRAVEELRNDSGSENGHNLSLLRIADRHGKPPPSPLPPQNTPLTFSTGVGTIEPGATLTTTIRLECWRRRVKAPNASPDAHRMVLEFWDGQTLWDVHNALVVMREDDLWVTINTKCGRDKEDGNDDDHHPSIKEASGCFFIENRFYKTGTVDYVQPILDWMDGGSAQGNPVRRGYLGISTMDALSVRDMKDVKLSQVPFRLGIRYYHCCHGDVETAIMLVDRQTARLNVQVKKATLYPSIHDIWTPSQWKAVPLCEACETHPALYVTSTECQATDGGPSVLCEECCSDLRVLEREPQAVMLYSTWRFQADLSTSVVRQHSTLF